MRPPDGPTGHPTVSVTSLRRYGAGGFYLDEQEAERGCPRQWRAWYVEKRVPEETSYALAYGSLFHDVMFRMVEDGMTPEEALEACFPPDGDPRMLDEARRDLARYLERGASPTDRYAALAVETHLDAPLFVDEQYGEIWFRGFIDWLGIDPDEPSIVHMVDYKTNRHPPSYDEVRGDQQLKAYVWLVRQNLAGLGITGAASVVAHLDAVKWREIEVRYTDDEIDAWHAWAVAVVRRLLRDEEGAPKINPGCAYCPVREDCPAFQDLPATAGSLVSHLNEVVTDEARLRWRDAANRVRLLLEKSVKSVDQAFERAARSQGLLRVGGWVFVSEPDWRTIIDMHELHRAMGDEFYDVVVTSKTALERHTADWEPYRVAQVRACVESVPAGSKVVRRRVEGEPR